MSVIGTAREQAAAAKVVHPLVRALCVADVFVDVRDGDQVATSERDGETYVHAHSEREAAERAAGGALVAGAEVRAVRLPQWLLTLPPGTCVRLDPDTPEEVVLGTPLVRLLVATGSGLPTPSALTPTGDERLVPSAGDGLGDLDAAVRGVVTGRLRRCVVTLEGVGGQEWPVYVVDGDGRGPGEVAAAVQEVAQRPVVVLVDRQPAWVGELVAPALGLAVTVD